VFFSIFYTIFFFLFFSFCLFGDGERRGGGGVQARALCWLVKMRLVNAKDGERCTKSQDEWQMTWQWANCWVIPFNFPIRRLGIPRFRQDPRALTVLLYVSFLRSASLEVEKSTHPLQKSSTGKEEWMAPWPCEGDSQGSHFWVCRRCHMICEFSLCGSRLAHNTELDACLCVNCNVKLVSLFSSTGGDSNL